MKLSRWIVLRAVPGFKGAEDADSRARVGWLEGWSSVLTNLLLFALKGAVGLFTGSVAILADAMHTLSDCSTSLVVLIGFRISGKPPDKQHPFGHGRAESVAAVVIAVLLGVVTVEVFRGAVGRLMNPKPIRIENWVFGVLIATLIVKELMARFSRDLGRLIKSDALLADAVHHRSDVLTTLLVIAALIGSRFNVVWLDGVMGMMVAGFIGWSAVAIMRAASGPLLGEIAPEEMHREIATLARTASEVLGVHDILVHRYGSATIVSLHIEVPATLSAMRLHEISDAIEDRIAARFPGHAIVHVDPVAEDHEHYHLVRGIVADVVKEAEGVTSYHDLRLTGGDERFKVVFDVTVEASTGDEGIRMLRQEMERRLRERFPLVGVAMNVEPPYFRKAPDPNDEDLTASEEE